MKMILTSKRDRYLARVSIFLTIIALIIGMVGCNASPSAGVEIRNWHDLDAIRNNLGGKFILMNDLDSTTAGYTELASPTANQGRGWRPIGTLPNTFTGSFDGQGFEIKDLFIGREGEDDVGLFSFVGKAGIIKNIAVTGVNVTGYMHTGGLAGYNSGTIDNCYSTGSVTSQLDIGGLVGENDGTVIDSYSTASVSGSDEIGVLIGDNHGFVSRSYSAGSATGNSYVGGLVGWNQEGTISNSYSSARVDGESLVGGLVGHNRASMSNCYSTGNVTGLQDVGGLVGRNYQGTVSNSFWDTETSGLATSYGGTGKNTTEMQDIATFSGAGWNMIAVALNQTNPAYIWNSVDNVTYPFLSWQPV